MKIKLDDFYMSFAKQAAIHEKYWRNADRQNVPSNFVYTAMNDISNLLNIIEGLSGENIRKQLENPPK